MTTLFGWRGDRIVNDRCDRLPTAAEIEAINAEHLIATPLRPADLLFVFGTREDVALRAQTAAWLWRAGLFRWSIVSGGVTPGSDQSECAIIKAKMVEDGIPADRILEEHRATNTSVPVLTFVSGCSSLVSECQNQRDTSKYMFLAWFWI